MADIKQILNNPEALQEFNKLPRSSRTAILSEADPDFKTMPVKAKFAVLDSFEAHNPKMAPAGTSPTIPTAEQEAIQPIAGPITDTLTMGALAESPLIKPAVSAATEAAGGLLAKGGNFANRVKTALTTSKSAAGQAIGDVERATPSAVKQGATLAEFPAKIPFTNASVNTLKTVEGQANYINQLEKAAANADKLPKEALNDYAKINDMIKNDITGSMRARLFELDAKITGALNKALPARGAAASTLADVSKAEAVKKALGAAAKTLGIGALGGLGFTGAQKVLR